jgi:hypothetical protein
MSPSARSNAGLSRVAASTCGLSMSVVDHDDLGQRGFLDRRALAKQGIDVLLNVGGDDVGQANLTDELAVLLQGLERAAPCARRVI